jgi:hypothetical protein
MPLLNATHNLSIRRSTELVASLSAITIVVPTRTPCDADGCGPDTTLGGALLPNCSTCGGSGYLDINMHSTVLARIRWWEAPVPGFVLSTGMMTDEIGKFTAVLAVSETRLIERAVAKQGSYVIIDNRRARILSWSPNHVIGSTSIEVACELEKEDVR